MKENYYVVMSFMVKDLKLKGIERDVYAIIYGFCQNKGKYSGSLQYLIDWTCSSKQGVINALNKLIEKKLLIKEEFYFNNVKFVEYSTTELTSGQETSPDVVKKVDRGGQETLLGGGQETRPNNIPSNNINNNTKYNIYGIYHRIKLTPVEYNNLITEFGEAKIQEVITNLDEYLEVNNNKNKYKNFNLVIRKAIRENWFSNKQNEKKNIQATNEPDWLQHSMDKLLRGLEG
jgi:hypothetical protein